MATVQFQSLVLCGTSHKVIRTPIHTFGIVAHKLKVAAVSAICRKLKMNVASGIRSLRTDGELPHRFLSDE